jgi:hypothetical protein
MSDKEAQPFFGRSSKEICPNRRTILGILTVACLGFGLWLHGIGIMSKGPEAGVSTDRKETMFVTKHHSAANHEIPPIDAFAPSKTETATFALG